MVSHDNIIFMESRVDIQELSNFLMDYTTSMMAVGVHTARAVRSVSRIAESYGYGVDLTIFQKNLTMTVKHPDDYSIRRTYVKKIPSLAINFQVISELSALSWEAYDHRLSLEELINRYRIVMSEPRMSRWIVLILVSLANTAFCRLFGGDAIAMMLVCGATFVGFLVRQEMMNRHLNHMVVFVISAFIASFIASAGTYFHWGETPEIALASSVLYLIPGVPLINSIIDILGGHVLIGMSRAVNAAILIVCIALGLSVTLLILGLDTL